MRSMINTTTPKKSGSVHLNAGVHHSESLTNILAPHQILKKNNPILHGGSTREKGTALNRGRRGHKTRRWTLYTMQLKPQWGRAEGRGEFQVLALASVVSGKRPFLCRLVSREKGKSELTCDGRGLFLSEENRTKGDVGSW